MPEFLSPSDRRASRSEVFVAYLDYFRESIIERVESLSEVESRASRLASGWTPVELLRHLTFVELRWLEWGFEGRDVANPWGDRQDDQWFVPANAAVSELVGDLRERGAVSTTIVSSHSLEEIGQPGPRWPDPHDPPSLERILFHLLQEYARHAGHLDIVAELAGGATGE